MIDITHLSKRYGSTLAVDDVSFRIESGLVTGLLGPNGAGKSTTMRSIVGLDRPTSGSVTVNGRPYRDYASPLSEVGVLLDAKAAHPKRSARDHLRVIAKTHGIPNRRVDEVIGLTGLDSVAGERVGGFSLGMGQRVGIATALLGDPRALILDEPVNGLDPEGVLWVRSLVRSLAAEGRAILLSSHLMGEMAQTADRLVVLGKGRVLADAPMTEIVGRFSSAATRVRSHDLAQVAEALRPLDAVLTQTDADTLEIAGPVAEQIAEAAMRAGVVLFEITPQTASLEEAFFALTDGSVEYRSRPAGAGTPAGINATETERAR
jgi:ABC-2 type transport system ATP-binding protein